MINCGTPRDVKRKFLQEIAVSDDMGKSAVLHNRLAKIAKGVLDSGDARYDAVVKLLRDNVTEHILAALEKYVDSACWDNFTLMEPLVKQVTWLSEEAMAIHQILCQKMKHATGGKGAELKLKELLELSRISNWISAKRVAARALAGLSRK